VYSSIYRIEYLAALDNSYTLFRWSLAAWLVAPEGYSCEKKLCAKKFGQVLGVFTRWFSQCTPRGFCTVKNTVEKNYIEVLTVSGWWFCNPWGSVETRGWHYAKCLIIKDFILLCDRPTRKNFFISLRPLRKKDQKKIHSTAYTVEVLCRQRNQRNSRWVWLV
jgi:hypothetical protein